MATNHQAFGYGDHFPAHTALGSLYSGLGELPTVPDNSDAQTKFVGNSQLMLVLRQAPVHARVALGKEKDRKPIDPPPVVQLIDKRNEIKSDLYNIPENFDIHTKLPEVSSTYLTGSLVSSIHRLKDSLSTEGGFFVFGDLCVKQEGRYRLRFTLYERDPFPENGSYSFVSELVSNVFTVYASRKFPGMTESTTLTRMFSDQGVKLRLRKETRTLTTRKRGRPAMDSLEVLMGRDTKRQSTDPDGVFAQSYDNLVPSPLDSSTSAPIGFPAPPFHNTNIPMSRHVSSTLPFATSHYYMANFPAPSFQ
ncbi:hypothetical protein NLU13_7231 [Sarocladium strictum]|uniref:Velvet domain-containing protein n=1 Tax=Sarocladium strictum TaxID=5046 RepID=A0AA39L5C5_SARSR|nr:hypothetical protein NLU13_7231 [Sarocladium strictum]